MDKDYFHEYNYTNSNKPFEEERRTKIVLYKCILDQKVNYGSTYSILLP